MMNRKLDWVIDECLSRVQTGDETVKDCVQAYPELKDVLEPLLALTLRVNETLAPEKPDAQFVRNAKIRILNRVSASTASISSENHQPKRTRRIDFRRRRWSTVIAGIVIAAMLFGSGFGMKQASASALPGDTLYPVKRAGEEIQLALSFTANGDIALLYEFADYRLEEAQTLSEEGRFDDLGIALEGFEDAMSMLEGIAQEGEIGNGKLDLAKIQAMHEKHIQVLGQVREQVPENARAAIDHAIERSGRSQEVLKVIQEGGKPSDLAPGQLKDKPEKDKDKEKPEKPDKPEK
ncbi:unnamed protein product [marine sediment metagenome]|uniref:DUF5667 domain-containing protein n=1 Tax=marine sediment metagenome TaxID=412755 RepID=X0TSJ6_9ZZZZ